MTTSPKRAIAAVTTIAYLLAPTGALAADPLTNIIQGLQGLNRVLSTVAPPPNQQPGQPGVAPLGAARPTGPVATTSQCEIVVQYDQQGRPLPCLMPAANQGTYQIEDPAYRLAARQRLDQTVAALQAKREIDAVDAARFVEAIRPFLSALENEQRAATSTDLVIPPGDTRVLDFRSYCLQYGITSPSLAAGMSLQPVTPLLPTGAQPMYEQIMAYARLNPGDHRAAISLIDGLTQARRGIMHNITPAEGLSGEQRALMDRVLPNGAYLYQQAVLSAVNDYNRLPREQQRQIQNELTDFYRANGDVAGKAASRRPRPTQLAPGVLANAQANSPFGADGVRVRFQNNSTDAYRFKLTNYAGAPYAAQRVGLAGATTLPKLSPEAAAAASAAVSDSARKLTDVTFKDATTIVPKLITHSAAAKALLSTLPWVGLGIATWEGVTGKDVFTGETLSPAQRLVSLAGVIPGERAIQGLIAPVAGPLVANVARYTANTADVAGVLVSDTTQALDPLLFNNDRVFAAVKESLDAIARGVGVPADIAATVRANLSTS